MAPLSSEDCRSSGSFFSLQSMTGMMLIGILETMLIGMEVLQTMLGMETILYLMPFGHCGPTAEGLMLERL